MGRTLSGMSGWVGAFPVLTVIISLNFAMSPLSPQPSLVPAELRERNCGSDKCFVRYKEEEQQGRNMATGDRGNTTPQVLPGTYLR